MGRTLGHRAKPGNFEARRSVATREGVTNTGPWPHAPAMASVTVYTTKVCPYCVRAKALHERRGIPFTEVDVTNDPDKRAWLVEASGRRTVPQIFIGEQAIGGSDDLHALDAAGRLAALVAS